MRSIRLTFAKTGTAAYTSHLDLTRLFTRALSRCNIEVKHSEGFHQRPHLVFGSPLSLGFAGARETLEFAVTDDMECEEIATRLKKSLPMGMEVVSVLEPQNKLKEIAYAQYSFVCHGVAAKGQEQEAQALFARKELFVVKKTKKREFEIDLIPMIEEIAFYTNEEDELCGDCTLVLGGEESLNPQYLIKAMKEQINGFESDYETFTRKAFLTKSKEIFN